LTFCHTSVHERAAGKIEKGDIELKKTLKNVRSNLTSKRFKARLLYDQIDFKIRLG